MKRLIRGLAVLLLSGVVGIGAVHAAGYSADVRSNNSPYDGAIRRANPNSRQGTESTVPGTRTLNTPNNPRPTLENGGIGNGYPTRPAAPSRPALNPSTVPTPDSTR